MFKQSIPSSQSNEFNANPLLFKEEVLSNEFSARDWANAPRVEYESTLYRKMAPPRTARVVDDSSGFKLETYGAKQEDVPAVNHPAKSNDMGVELEVDLLPNEDRPNINDVNIKNEPLKAMDFSEKTHLEADKSLEAGDQSNFKTSEDVDVVEAKSTNELHSSTDADEVGAITLDNSHHEEVEINKSQTALKNENNENVDDQSVGNKEISELSNLNVGDTNTNASTSLQNEIATQESLLELSSLKTQLELKNKEWDEERSQLNQKIHEIQDSLAYKENEYASNLQRIEDNSNEKINSQLEILKEVTSRVEEFTKSPDRLFEPVKRLSMHIAEQLVLAELNLSGSSIERLIQRCLDEMSNRSEPSVIVELNIQDKDRLEEMSGDVTGHIQLRGVPGLQIGSVRVISDDTQVDDLITNRLEGMAHSLLAQPEIWREKSPFFRQPLAQRDSEVQDVRQRIASSDDSFVENFND